MLFAQWVLNILQFLTLLVVIWYAWETHKMGARTERQQEREWKPSYHFSINTCDPTTATGESRSTDGVPIPITTNVVNLGRAAILIRGFLLRAPGANFSSMNNCAPIPLASGAITHFDIPLQNLVW